MVFEYTIPAVPTMYDGRRYRSRLEARWAAFFDQCGWHFEYEPVDLGTWSPDFAIWGVDARFPLMAEVKPILEWDRDTARKMADACVHSEQTICFFLLLGAAPQVTWSGQRQVGWVGMAAGYEARWTETIIGRDSLGRPDLQASSRQFCQETLLWRMHEKLAPVDTDSAWKTAANRVQWKPPPRTNPVTSPLR